MKLPVLIAMMLAGLAALVGAGHAAAPGAERARIIDWPDLLPDAERAGYVAGPPPAAHGGYLDGFGSNRQFGRFDDDPARECTGVARRFNPDCEAREQRAMSSAVNERLEGQLVRISGYLVPLEVAPDGSITEFFLAPYLGACIHVPPPPPNQMIHARVSAKQGLRSLHDVYAIAGVLRTQGKILGIGGSAYSLEVKSAQRL